MLESINSERYEIDHLKYTTGLRTWAKDHHCLPEAAAQLLEAANRLELTPSVMLIEFSGDNWQVILHGEH